jgi:hypothetical protein
MNPEKITQDLTLILHEIISTILFIRRHHHQLRRQGVTMLKWLFIHGKDKV